jgi:hypothetical protein
MPLTGEIKSWRRQFGIGGRTFGFDNQSSNRRLQTLKFQGLEPSGNSD